MRQARIDLQKALAVLRPVIVELAVDFFQNLIEDLVIFLELYYPFLRRTGGAGNVQPVKVEILENLVYLGDLRARGEIHPPVVERIHRAGHEEDIRVILLHGEELFIIILWQVAEADLDILAVEHLIQIQVKIREMFQLFNPALTGLMLLHQILPVPRELARSAVETVDEGPDLLIGRGVLQMPDWSDLNLGVFGKLLHLLEHIGIGVHILHRRVAQIDRQILRGRLRVEIAVHAACLNKFIELFQKSGHTDELHFCDCHERSPPYPSTPISMVFIVSGGMEYRIPSMIWVMLRTSFSARKM